MIKSLSSHESTELCKSLLDSNSDSSDAAPSRSEI